MSEPRRVLHIIDTGGPGGAETILDTIVGHLTPEAWQSRVVVPTNDWLFTRLQARSVDAIVVPANRAVDIGYLAQLVRQIRDFCPVIIHAHLLGSGVYGSLAAALTNRAPLVCTFHGRPDVSADDRLLPLKARILGRHQNRIAYVSHDLRAYLEPLLCLPKRSGVVVHNGVEFLEPNTTGTERGDCGAGPGDVRVGAVGNIRPAKDYTNLLRAAAIVCEAQSNVRFAIVGDERSPLTAPLRRMTEDLGLTEHVRFLGFRDDVTALVATFDLFVSSSRTEGLPLATVEAVALGTPVVLTRTGGVPEVVESGKTGLLVPPGSAGALAEGILKTLAGWKHAVEMAQAGASDVRQRFGARRMCDAYQELYEQLILSG